MKHYAFVDGLGNFRSSVTVPHDVAPEPPTGCRAIETPCHLDPATKAFVGGRFVDMPSAPEYPADFSPSLGRWVPNISAAWAQVRAKRDQLISASDWVVLPDVGMSPERKQSWLDYRQALRDITKQTDPTSIVWPKAPS